MLAVFDLWIQTVGWTIVSFGRTLLQNIYIQEIKKNTDP
jgi:hypothetical protein